MAGRFISRDPIGFKGGDINLYSMVRNNPINLVDPFGLKTCPPGYEDGPDFCIPVQDPNSKCRPGTVWDGDLMGGGCVDQLGKEKETESYGKCTATCVLRAAGFKAGEEVVWHQVAKRVTSELVKKAVPYAGWVFFGGEVLWCTVECADCGK